MPQTVNVSLDCRNFKTTNDDSYTNVTGSNGQWYSFKYSGGSDNKGDVTVTQGSPTDIVVTIHADPRYDVSTTEVTNDPEGDISTSTSTKSATFSDSAADEEHGIHYKITVLDTVANATFLADPRIDNIKN